MQNTPDKQGATPLWRACEADMAEVVELLLAMWGTNMFIADNIARTPLFVACGRGDATF